MNPVATGRARAVETAMYRDTLRVCLRHELARACAMTTNAADI